MNYTFTNYRDLLLASLASLQAPDGYLLELRGFAGDIVLTENGTLLVLLNRFPAVLVEIPKADYKPGGYPFRDQEVTVILHVCTRSLRSQDEAMDGRGGISEILDDLRTRLLGRKLAEDLLPLEIISESKSAAGLTENNEYVLVYQAEYRFTNNRIREDQP